MKTQVRCKHCILCLIKSVYEINCKVQHQTSLIPPQQSQTEQKTKTEFLKTAQIRQIKPHSEHLLGLLASVKEGLLKKHCPLRLLALTSGYKPSTLNVLK
jgi:hypothetical protein